MDELQYERAADCGLCGWNKIINLIINLVDMIHYIDLFSPETYDNFSISNKAVSGFRETQRGVAKNIKPGDKLICYLTKLSRWVGILKVKASYYEDNSPIFVQENDPFNIRFNVEPIVWLPIENCIPIHEDLVWNNLSFTKDLHKNDTRWTGRVRGSLSKLSNSDGQFLEKLLLKQNEERKSFLITEEDKKKLKVLKVKTGDNKEIAVEVPENDDEKEPLLGQIPARESIKIQALIAEIGDKMNLKIWLPKNDRNKVFEQWKPSNTGIVLDHLPLNYDDTTLKTIENIDVIWIKGRSIVRAFEVEHTTSIYSGILRMADLMALQPNLNIRAHIVAPNERREKVLQEISRPVFTLLEKGPLSESCTFISYESILELSKEKRIEYMNDKVLEEFEEYGQN